MKHLLLVLIALSVTVGAALAQFGPGVPNVGGNGGGASSASPTPVPTLSVPTAVQTTGPTLTTMTGASQATNDLEVCYLNQNQANGSFNCSAAGSCVPGWSVLDNGVATVQAGVWSAFVAHCVQQNEPATVSFPLGAGNSTVMACLLIRQGCAGGTVDVGGTESGSGGSSATVTYPAITTTLPNDLMLYGASWTDTTSMSSNPAGVTFPVTLASNGSHDGVQIGYKSVPVATTIAQVTGTLAGSTSNSGGTAAITP